MVDEPCSRCGEETGAGRAWFSDRKVIENAGGRRTFLCPLCDPRVRSTRRGQRLTAEEADNLAKNGSAAGLALGNDPGGFASG